VHVRPARLDDERHERLAVIAQRQRRRGLERVGQGLELRPRRVLQSRAHAAGELDEPDAQRVAPARVTHDEPLVQQRPEQTVDAGAMRLHLRRQGRDGQAVGVLGEDAQHPQPTLERQRVVRR
jgi:hypothetical protein